MLSIPAPAPSIAPMAYRAGASPTKSGSGVWFILLIAVFIGGVGFACLKYVAPKLEARASATSASMEGPLVVAKEPPPPPLASAEPSPSSNVAHTTAAVTKADALTAKDKAKEAKEAKEKRARAKARAAAAGAAPSASSADMPLPSDRLSLNKSTN